MRKSRPQQTGELESRAFKAKFSQRIQICVTVTAAAWIHVFVFSFLLFRFFALGIVRHFVLLVKHVLRHKK